MGFIAFLLIGLIAGAIAKLILPGRQGGGWVITLILGIVGALVGGFLSTLLLGDSPDKYNFFSLSTWISAIVGSLIVLVIYGFVTGRKGSRA